MERFAGPSLHALVVLQSLVCLKAAINTTLAHVEDNPSSALATLLCLKKDVNGLPLGACFAHGLGGSFSDLSTKQKKQLAKSIKDQQMNCWVKETNKLLYPPHSL